MQSDFFKCDLASGRQYNDDFSHIHVAIWREMIHDISNNDTTTPFLWRLTLLAWNTGISTDLSCIFCCPIVSCNKLIHFELAFASSIIHKSNWCGKEEEGKQVTKVWGYLIWFSKRTQENSGANKENKGCTHFFQRWDVPSTPYHESP